MRRILALAVMAGLLLIPGAATAATHHPAGHRIARISVNDTFLYLVNAPPGTAEITGQGDDVQAQLESTGGPRFTQDGCGGFVYAFRNQTMPYKYLHFQSSNGHISVSRETTNGCSNAADKFTVTALPNGCEYSPTGSGLVVGTNSPNDGTKVFAGNPSWVAIFC